MILQKCLIFGGDPDPHVDSGSLFHFLHHCGIGDFLYSQRTLCPILSEMNDADKIMHPQHFGTDPTDILIRIRMPDHFR